MIKAGSTDALTEFQPSGGYRRRLRGADFSLESNTPATPQSEGFYLLQGGRVVFRSGSFQEAMEAYHQLCRDYWKGHLESDDVEQRVASAWGLIGLDPNDPRAAEVIKEDGSAADSQRLEQLRRRHRWKARQGPRNRARQ